MSNPYVSYLRQLNSKLKREGIVLPITITDDLTKISDRVVVMEQFLYFNDVLTTVDSNYKLEDILGFRNISFTEYLTNKITEEKEAEWSLKLAELTKQPSNAGVVDKPVEILQSRHGLKLFTEALNLHDEPVEDSQEVESKPFWLMGSTEFDFEEETDDTDFSDYDNYDETEDYDDVSEGDYSDYEYDDNSSSDENLILSDEDSIEVDDYSVYAEDYSEDTDYTDEATVDDELPYDLDYSQYESSSQNSDDSDDYDLSAIYGEVDDSDEETDDYDDYSVYDYSDDDSTDSDSDEDTDDFDDYSVYEEDEEDSDSYSSDEDDYDDYSVYESDDESESDDSDDYDDYSVYAEDESDSDEDVYDYSSYEDDVDDYSVYEEEEPYDALDAYEEEVDDYSVYESDEDEDTSYKSLADEHDLDDYFDEYADESLDEDDNLPFGGINSQKKHKLYSKDISIKQPTVAYPPKLKTEDMVADYLRDAINDGLSALFNLFG